MTGKQYLYDGLRASTWDVWRDDTKTWADRALYLRLIERYGQPVLDVGCGTGRLLLDYRELGLDVDGLDNAPEMLNICRRKARLLGWTQDDVERHILLQSVDELDTPRRYRTILVPSSTLQILVDPVRAQRALAGMYRQLEPGGALVASFGFIWRPGDPLETDWELSFEKVRPTDGAVVSCWKRRWWEPERQWWHTELRFKAVRNGTVLEQETQRMSPECRWYTQDQAIELYRAAGFANVRALQDFRDEPARPDADVFCVLGIKPGSE